MEISITLVVQVVTILVAAGALIGFVWRSANTLSEKFATLVQSIDHLTMRLAEVVQETKAQREKSEVDRLALAEVKTTVSDHGRRIGRLEDSHDDHHDH